MRGWWPALTLCLLVVLVSLSAPLAPAARCGQQACAPKVRVKSWPFSIEQHVHSSSLRRVLKHPGQEVSLLSIITEHAQSDTIHSHDGGWGESSICLK